MARRELDSRIPPLPKISADVVQLEDLPGWPRWSKYQKGYLERRPYVTSDRAAYEYVEKNFRWFAIAKAHSAQFAAATEWIKDVVPPIPDYDVDHMARKADHYLAQILDGKIKASEASRITVAKYFSSRAKDAGGGPGKGKGGRKVFRADDDMTLTGLPSSYSDNGGSASDGQKGD